MTINIRRPDRSRPEPLWHQAEQALRALIADGTWPDGTQLPNEGKLGEMLRHKGSVRGTQLVPRTWIEFMTRPSPRAADYGAHLWLNRDSGGERVVLYPEQGPRSAFAAVGHLGQYVIVSPAQKLTIVRLGKTDDEQRRALVDEIARIAALYPVT